VNIEPLYKAVLI